jgi:glycosyltransferase involved in cell wall biosynthesis
MQNNPLRTSVQETQPLVTFIVAYYNLPVQMLFECIDSILALSLKPEEREILIIDDGSEVSPMNGLMRYGNDIIYVRQPNGGLSAARNKGIETATGRYLQFVDADDHLITAPYEHCLDIVRTNAGIDMVMFDFTSSTDNQQAFSDQPIVSGTEYMLKNNIHGTACGYLFLRTVLSDLRFTPGTWHEDEEFTPQLLIRAERLCVTNAKAYYYHKHSGSITTQADDESKDKRLSDIRGVIRRLHMLCDRVPRSDRMAMQRRIAQLTMDYIYQTIVQKRSSQALEACIAELRDDGLFPLPNRNYSKKYMWFRQMSNTRIGRAVLLRTLPMLKRER